MIYLEAKEPLLNVARFYCIELTQDLFQDYVLQTSYGRIGTQGSYKRYIFCTINDALPKIKFIIALRASAPRRSGYSYKIVKLYQDSCLSDLNIAKILMSSTQMKKEIMIQTHQKKFLPLFDNL